MGNYIKWAYKKPSFVCFWVNQTAVLTGPEAAGLTGTGFGSIAAGVLLIIIFFLTSLLHHTTALVCLGLSQQPNRIPLGRVNSRGKGKEGKRGRKEREEGGMATIKWMDETGP